MSVDFEAGYRALSRAELEERLLAAYNGAFGVNLTMAQYAGTNAHRAALTDLALAETLQESLDEAFKRFYRYLADQRLVIESATGPTFDGLSRLLAPHSAGCAINFLTRVVSEEEAYGGAAVVAVDSPSWNVDDAADAVAAEIFGRGSPLGTLFRSADPVHKKTVSISAGNGQTFIQEYRALYPADYTKIDVQIHLTPKVSADSGRVTSFSVLPALADLAEDLRHKVAALCPIGVAFYPDALLNPADYPSVARFVLKTKLAGDTAWVEGPRTVDEPDFCMRYTPGDVSLEIVS